MIILKLWHEYILDHLDYHLITKYPNRMSVYNCVGAKRRPCNVLALYMNKGFIVVQMQGGGEESPHSTLHRTLPLVSEVINRPNGKAFITTLNCSNILLLLQLGGCYEADQLFKTMNWFKNQFKNCHYLKGKIKTMPVTQIMFRCVQSQCNTQ